VPLSLGGSANHLAEGRYQLLCRALGIEVEPRRTLVGYYTTPDYRPLLDRLGTDIRYIHIRPPRGYVAHPLTAPFEPFVDEWGIRHSFESGFYQLTGAPLAKDLSVRSIEQYPWPDPYDPVRLQGVRDEVLDLYNNTRYAIAAHRPVYGNCWEFARLMVGMEQALIMTVQDRKLFDALISKLTDVLNGFYDAFLDVVGPYVQIVEMAEDLGTATGPMISPRFYREVIRPKHEATVRLIKEKASNAKILLHCDGAIRAFIPDLIAAGFDILNPIEPNLPGMDPAELKREYGKDICFQGGVDVKGVLPRGSVDDVRAEVRLRMEQMAEGGGYILGPSHNLLDDVPIENILALVDARV